MTAPADHAPTIDGPRLIARLDELSSIGRTARFGVTREAYGTDDVRARDLVRGWMIEAGLTPTVDAATNLIGRRPGPGHGRSIASGSHLDTVVEGGALDGAYGVVAAVEVAAAVHRSSLDLRHELIVVAFANEEGARGTDGMVGSRALVGDVAQMELDSVDDDEVTLARRLSEAGGDPAAVAAARWRPDSIAAFVELHIEQGPVLSSGGYDLGVVTGITGRQAVEIKIVGTPNHAGTTPMDLRRDALVAAAELILAIEALAHDGVIRVATCGRLQTTPNVRNVVPGTAALSAELRDQSPEALAAGRAAVEAATTAVADRRDVQISLSWAQYVPPIDADPTIVEVTTEAAERSGRGWCALPSGAGHDAQILGRVLPIGMIFVPSQAGVSHSPDEHTDPPHLIAGADLLLDSILRLDQRLDAESGPQ
jgi:N-carbamoyl-L-amino-acid hydrolase